MEQLVSCCQLPGNFTWRDAGEHDSNESRLISVCECEAGCLDVWGSVGVYAWGIWRGAAVSFVQWWLEQLVASSGGRVWECVYKDACVCVVYVCVGGITAGWWRVTITACDPETGLRVTNTIIDTEADSAVINVCLSRLAPLKLSQRGVTGSVTFIYFPTVLWNTWFWLTSRDILGSKIPPRQHSCASFIIIFDIFV